MAEPGQVTEGNRVKSFTEGKDWIVLVEKEEDQEKLVLTLFGHSKRMKRCFVGSTDAPMDR